MAREPTGGRARPGYVVGALALALVVLLPGAATIHLLGSPSAPAAPSPAPSTTGASVHGSASAHPSEGPGSITGPLAWTPVNTSTAPPYRGWGGMTYDAADGYLLLFGGEADSGPALNDTWAFADGQWTDLCRSGDHGPTCDAPDLSNCSLLPTPAGMTYDALDGYVLMVDCLGETWAFSGGLWTREAAETTLPNARTAAAPLVTYDPSDGYVVLFTLAADGRSSETWTYAHGNWTELSESVYPPAATYVGAMFYDDALGAVILPSEDNENQTWAFHAGMWSPLAPPTELPGCDAASSYDSAFGYGVVFSICSERTYPAWTANSTWVFENGTWTNVSASLPIAPSYRLGAQMAYDPVEGYTVLFGGCNCSFAPNPPNYNDTWILSDPVTLRLAATPSVIDLGETAMLNASVLGGFPPFTFNDSALPASCLAVVGPGRSPCTPASTGVTPVTLGVVDAMGAPAWATAEITVNPALTENATAGPTPTTVGGSVRFAATVTGGTLPLSPEWTLSDGANVSSLTFSHAFSEPGNFTANFSVGDARGFLLGSSFVVRINPGLGVTVNVNQSATDVGWPVALSANVTGGTSPFTYAWALGDGTTSDHAQLSHAYPAVGTYPITVRTEDVSGANASDTRYILVNPDLVVTASANATEVADGAPIAFAVAFTGGTAPFALDWSFGDAVGDDSSANPVHAYRAAGNYSVTVTVRDAAGAAQTAQLSVHVAAPTSGPASPAPTNGPAHDWLPWTVGGILLVAAVVALAAFFLHRARLRRGPG